MNFIYYILVLFGLLVSSCSSDFDGVKILGKVKGGKGKNIFLAYQGKIDSVQINKEDAFEFKIHLSEPDFCNLYLDPTNPILLFVDSTNNLTIEVNTDAEKFSSNYTVKGSKTSEHIRDLQNRLVSTYNQVRNAYKQIEPLLNDSSLRDSIYTDFVKNSNEIVQKHREYVLNFIRNNPSSFACLPAIYQAFDSRSPLFTYENDAQYYHLIDSALMAKYPYSMQAKEFHAQLIQLKKQYEARFSIMRTPINEAPDFTLNDRYGKPFKLSSLRGSYILLDFWASWCAPCRLESPTIVEAGKRFSKKGLKIVQVSLDNDKNKWIEAIEKDKLIHSIHVSDLLYWNSPVAKLYGVQAIPANFLIDPSGKIIAQNLRGNNLITMLETIFEKPTKNK